MPFSVVDLFCGCGGLSLGLKKSGFEVVAGLDSWADAISVYEANHKTDNHDCIVHDLSDVSATVEIVSRYEPFMIAGGPPCQDFSSAGTRKEGSRADLTVKFAETVVAVRPTSFMMENVSRAQHSDAMATAKQLFKAAGYGLTFVVLDASLCGVPQIRKRMFLIGIIGEEDGFLEASIKEALSKTPMTMRDYFGDEVPFDHYYRHPRTYERRAIYSMDEPSPTIRGVNRPMPGTYKHHKNDAAPPSVAVRSLSLEHRARIQTFPPGYFDAAAPKAAKEQMVGNAVPVELAHFVADKLFSFISARMPEERPEKPNLKGLTTLPEYAAAIARLIGRSNTETADLEPQYLATLVAAQDNLADAARRLGRLEIDTSQRFLDAAE